MNHKLKAIKYLFFAVLVMAGLMFNGELFKLYADNFQEAYYQCSFAFNQTKNKASNQAIARKFMEEGEKCGVDFFMVDQRVKSLREDEVTVYGTEGALESLEEDGIKAGVYSSLFMGVENIETVKFESLENITDFESCYFIGGNSEVEAMREFKSNLVDEYGGGFPHLQGSNTETWLNLLAVWLLVFIIMLLITWYEVVCQKKEIAVRMILGSDVRKIIGKSILLDTALMILIFVLGTVFVNGATNSLFKISFVSKIFVVFLIMNGLLIGDSLRINFRKNLGARHNEGSKFLTVNYAIKILVTMLVVVAMAGNILLIKEGVDYYKQRSFFEEHAGYSIYQFWYAADSSTDKTIEDEEALYAKFNQKYGEKAIKFSDYTSDLGQDYPTILINENYLKELMEKSEELEEKCATYSGLTPYILLPKGISKDSSQYKTALLIYANCNDYDLFDTKEIEKTVKVIEYEGNVEVIAMNNRTMEGDSHAYNNPILILDESTFAQPSIDLGVNMMYEEKDVDFTEFISENHLENEMKVRTNVLEMYELKWAEISQSMKIGIVLGIFILSMEAVLITFLITMQYRFNAMELALKKIFGYSVFARNKHILKLTIGATLAGLAGSFVMCKVLGVLKEVYGYVIISAVILLVLEIFFIMIKARKIEKVTLSNILKGDSL